VSKHNILTEQEFLEFKFKHKRTLQYIETYRKENNLLKKDMNILDWGCGRGRETLWLRENGYNAYGVDIDEKPINNGIALFKAYGYDPLVLSLITLNNKTKFPENYFHFTYSNQVFEHVSNIESVANEIRRITRNNGAGFHVFPAHKCIQEGHLFMPFVHWLPKNKLRKYFISFYVIFGKEPFWPALDKSNIKNKINTYYQYSINKTFYRKYSDLKSVFERWDFHVRSEIINSPHIKNHKYFGKLSNFKLIGDAIHYLLRNYKTIELFITKSHR
jgi:ubiquinone/menaquinone biosynthesis C-methylase UbiE